MLTTAMVSSTLAPSFAYAQESDLLPVEEILQEQNMDDVFSEDAALAAIDESFEEISGSVADIASDSGIDAGVLTEGEDFFDSEELFSISEIETELFEEDADFSEEDADFFAEDLFDTENDVEDGFAYAADEEDNGFDIAEEEDDLSIDIDTEEDFEENMEALPEIEDDEADIDVPEESTEAFEEDFVFEEDLDEEAAELTFKADAQIDNSTTLPDGEYTPEMFEYAFTSGKAKLDIVKFVVEDGKATGYFTASSQNMTHVYLGEVTDNAEDPSLYDPVTNTCGENVYTISDQQVSFPVMLNTESPVAARTTAMTEPHWVQYHYTITIEEPQIEELTITNTTNMFKAVTAYLEKADGNTTLVVALSGNGYHELFKGTYEQAVANAAITDNWIHGYQNADGKWEFRIPIAAGETYIPCVAISDSYYQKYLSGQNSLARAFYPRQFKLDEAAKTLVVGDYEFTQELAVTNNVTMFKVSAASLHTVGGPNSNNYAADLLLTMGSESFDKAYVGTAEEAGAAPSTIAIGEGNVFTIPVKWVEIFGKPETMRTWIGEPTVVSFHSVKKDAWYQRKLTIDEENGTLLIEIAPVMPAMATITQKIAPFCCSRIWPW